MNVFTKIRLEYRRFKYRKLHHPPNITYKKSKWYDKRWEIMCGKNYGNDIALPTICGWCEQLVPAYHPLRLSSGGGTGCHECGRTVDSYYMNWVYRAEYLDGCVTTIYQNGCWASGGPKHGPHSGFVPNDIPIYEFVPPFLLKAANGYSEKELYLFFRKCAEKHHGLPANHSITNLIFSLPLEKFREKFFVSPFSNFKAILAQYQTEGL